jgi:two-component system, chemotaxis family, sensor kinase CheA
MTDASRPSTEFLTEAQEVIEAFSHNLLELDAQQRSGDHDPDVLNAAFRAVHSLKGLAALFGAGPIAALSHSLEGTLDALRLGKIPLSPAALDVLFECVEAFQRMLGTFGEGKESTAEIGPLLDRIEQLSGGGDAKGRQQGSESLGGLDESILGVLTEYEEHRLRENIRLGRKLYRVHASFDLLAIDVGIEALKTKMKEYGEVITYLPSADSSAEDRIDLDILVGSDRLLAEIAGGVAEDGVTVHELTRGSSMSGPLPPTPATVPSHAAASSAHARGAGRADPSAHPATTSAGARAEPLDPELSAADAGEGGAEPEPGGELSLRSLSQTVRVDLERLDHLMNLIGELGVVQANLGTSLDRLRRLEGTGDISRDFLAHLRSMARKLSLLQQGLLDVRMVPLGQVFDKLARVVRKLGRDSGKEIRLTISGAQTELDKLIVEELSDPLMHMVRNCIDHGIEHEHERAAQGKVAGGRIDLRAYQKGNRVVIEVEDDGRGIDWREIRDVGLRRGMVTAREAREMSSTEILELMFRPGFTTRETATELSGRGVGMDVVKTNISRLSGMIDVDTAPGRGTKFSITLPVTLAIIQALVIECGGQTFCIPLNAVLESIMVHEREIGTVEGHEVISLRGRTLPLLHLSRIFELPARPIDPERIYVVVVGLAQHRVGLVVDDLAGQQDVVIKPLGSALRGVPGIAGATELGANRTVLLIDVATLVDEALGRADVGRGPATRGTRRGRAKGEVSPHGP